MKLLKLSLITSFIGIFLLLLLSTIIQPKEVLKYSDLELDSYAKTTAKVISIKSYDNFKIIKLNNNITLTCNNCKLKEKQIVAVTGKVTEYKDQLQINAEKIESLN